MRFPIDSIVLFLIASFSLGAEAAPPSNARSNAPAKIPGIVEKSQVPTQTPDPRRTGGGGAEDLLGDTKYTLEKPTKPPGNSKVKLGVVCTDEHGSALPSDHPGYAKCMDSGPTKGRSRAAPPQ